MKKNTMNQFVPGPLQMLVLAAAFFTAAQAVNAQTTFTWSATPASPVNDWNTPANWGSAFYPGENENSDTAIFNGTGTSASATSTNNVVNVNTTISTLLYTNIVSGAWQVTGIPGGITLSVTNMTVGVTTTVLTNNSDVTDVSLLDAGTLLVNSNLTVGSGGATSDGNATLNMSGLSNFVMNASGATLQLGTGVRSQATLDLANESNYIQIATFNDNTPSTSGSASGNVQLGGGTNIIYANTFAIAAGRGSSTVSFAGASGGLLVRGTAGTAANFCALTLGNRNNSGGSGNSSVGTLSLDGHPANLYLSTLTMGESGSAPTGAAPGTGTLSFDTGTVFANSVVMAVSSGTTVNATANGTLNVGSTTEPAGQPTLFIGSTGVSLVNQGASSGAATGSLNITNATVVCSNNIVQTTAAGIGTVNVNTGGTLYMVTGTIGTASIPVHTVTLNSATLVLSNSVNSATANVYGTTVSATSGTIVITNISGVIPTFSTTTIPLISYTGSSPASGLTLVMNPAITNSLGGAVTASLNDSGTQIQLQFIPTGPPPVSVVWTGATNGDWDYTTTNWAAAGNITNYADGDFVQFDDTLLSNSVINLTAQLNPAQTTVSNDDENYTFNGTGSVTNGALIKLGTDSLLLDNSGANTFTSVAITNGTVQIGNNDNLGSIGSGSVSDDGTLDLDRNDNALNLGNTISGPGSVVDNGAPGSVVTLSANNNSFSGGLSLDSGALVAAVGGSISTSVGTINFNGGFLAYGVAVGATNTTDYSSRFSTASGEQYNIYVPTSPGSNDYASVQVTFASPLTSSGGTLLKTGGGELIFTATNTFNSIIVDGGMVRANNTNGFGTITSPIAVSEGAPNTEIYFNVGSWTYSNNLIIQGYGAPEEDPPVFSSLGAIRMAATGVNLAGTITLINNAGISPRSANPGEISGKITDNGSGYGIQFGHTSTTTSPGSGTLILSNTADSWGGDTTISDGTLKLGASGVIPSGISAGNLAFTNPGTSFNASIANSVFDLNGYSETVNGLVSDAGVSGSLLWVTNSGGAAVTLTVGDNNASGSFNGIIGNGANALSLTKTGAGTETLSGDNAYTGNTAISAGTLALSGSATIASPSISVTGGATFDVSALTSGLTLGSGQTLGNSGSTATINSSGVGAITTGPGNLALAYDGVHASFNVTGGPILLSGNTVVTINNTSLSPLAAGTYTIISSSSGGSVSGTVPTTFSVTGNGIAPGTTNSLAITGTALNLVVTPLASPATITGISLSGTTLTLNATNGADGGQFVLMETTNLTPPVVWTPVVTNNFNGSGDLVNFTTSIVNSNDPAEFYLLLMP